MFNDDDLLVRPARYFGRTFVIQGEVIEPCEVCGTPRFPYARHVCIALDWHLLDYEMSHLTDVA